MLKINGEYITVTALFPLLIYDEKDRESSRKGEINKLWLREMIPDAVEKHALNGKCVTLEIN